MASYFNVTAVTRRAINHALRLLCASASLDGLCSIFVLSFFTCVPSDCLASARCQQGEDVSAVITELPLNPAAEILEASVPMEEPVASEPAAAAAAAADNDVWVEVL